MTDPESPMDPHDRQRRFARLGPGVWRVVGVSFLVAPLVVLFIGHRSINAARRDAIAQADRVDPGWRLRELQAKREVVPDEQNAAVRVAAVVKALPDDWIKNPPGPKTPPTDWSQLRGLALHAALEADHPNVLLTAQQAEALDAESRRVEQALQLARSLVGYPKGRYAIAYAPNYLSTSLAPLEETRTAARLLEFDVAARSQAGDVAGSLHSCQAILNTARSIGDEPNLIAQLIRIAIRSVTAQAAERSLALGEPSDTALVAMQEELLRELAEPAGLYALRGERAHLFEMFRALEDGEITPEELSSDQPDKAGSQGPRFAQLGYLFYANNQAVALRFQTEAVEIIKKPPSEQVALWQRWRNETTAGDKSRYTKVSGILARLLVAPLDASGLADVRSKANLGTCVALITVERFRRSRGRWPDSLDEVERTFAITLPRDPYVGQAFRLKRTDDGVVVYSVSSDRTDNGGALNNRRPDQVGADLGYRLWNVDKRRLPPPS